MFSQFKSNVLAPVSTRLGSLVSGGLVGLGAQTDHANWVGIGVASGLLISVDLMAAWLRKRAIQRKAVSSIPGSY